MTVVNVKPAERLQERKVKDALRWAGDLFVTRGWRSEVWSGTDPVVMSNVRFLAGYRRQTLFDPALVAMVGDVIQDGDRIGEIEQRLHPRPPAQSRPVILHLLWKGVLRADLSAPLDGETVVTRP